MEEQESKQPQTIRKPLKVGLDIMTGYEKKKVSMSDVRSYDPDGWVDVENFLPEDYELVKVKLEDGRLRQGWLQWGSWIGVGIKKSHVIEFWKQLEYEDRTHP